MNVVDYERFHYSSLLALACLRPAFPVHPAMCSILLSTAVSQESLQVYFQSYVMEMTRLRSVIHPVWALLPSIATIFCLSFLPYYFPANTPTHKRLFPNGKASDIFTTIVPFLKEHPALNPLLAPLYYFFALPVCSWAAGKDEAGTYVVG